MIFGLDGGVKQYPKPHIFFHRRNLTTAEKGKKIVAFRRNRTTGTVQTAKNPLIRVGHLQQKPPRACAVGAFIANFEKRDEPRQNKKIRNGT